MVEEKTRLVEVRNEIAVPAEPPEYQERQRRTMVIALGLLLVALAVVIVRDRDFWFPGNDEPVADLVEPSTHQPIGTVKSAPLAPDAGKAKKQAPPTSKPSDEAAPLITATDRTVLPPLQVEVVAGDDRKTVRPGSNSVNVDLQPRVPPRPSQDFAVQGSAGELAAVNAAERVRLSPETTQALTYPVTPDYPLLARQMKVQGSVLLQALISRDGSIQDLRVVSGPAILAAAAREAVKQWRFKPYYADGQPVETQARITVNFTISTN